MNELFLESKKANKNLLLLGVQVTTTYIAAKWM